MDEKLALDFLRWALASSSGRLCADLVLPDFANALPSDVLRVCARLPPATCCLCAFWVVCLAGGEREFADKGRLLTGGRLTGDGKGEAADISLRMKRWPSCTVRSSASRCLRLYGREAQQHRREMLQYQERFQLQFQIWRLPVQTAQTAQTVQTVQTVQTMPRPVSGARSYSTFNIRYPTVYLVDHLFSAFGGPKSRIDVIGKSLDGHRYGAQVSFARE